MIKKMNRIFKKYFSLVSIKDFYLISFILFNILTSLSELLIPYMASQIINYITIQSYNGAIMAVLLLLIIYIFHNVFLYFDFMCYAKFFKRCYVRIHSKLINSVYEFDEGFATKIPIGKIVNSSNMDIVNIAELPSFLFSIIIQTIKLIVILIVFFKQNIWVGLYVIVINFLYCYMASYCNEKNALYFKKQRKYADKLTGLLSQVLNGLRDIKSFNFSDKLNNKFDTYRKKWELNYYIKRKYFFIKKTLVIFFVQFGKILLYLFLIFLIINGKMDLTLFLLLIAYYDKFKTTVETIMSDNMSIIEESVSLYRICDIIDYNTNNLNIGINENDVINGKIEFKNVTFKYKDIITLKNVSFTVNPNKVTAIVGHTGAGKTTIFNLLLKFYKLDKGKILIDNVDIYDYSKQVYSSNIAVVNQKTFIFNMSIRDNLSLVDSNKERQINACKRVGIHDFIMSLPKGYNTVLKEDATNISGGQKQLLSLARALLTTSEIILLDEITSSLDPKTTNAIIQLMNDLKIDHTILIVTHNKELMKNVDQLVVLNHGKVIGIGNHNDLIKNNDYYKELFNH